jgi:hypothetical protein
MPDHGAGPEAPLRCACSRAGLGIGGRGPGLGIGDWGPGTLWLAGGLRRTGRFASLREELLDVVHRVVRFARVQIGFWSLRFSGAGLA